MSIPIDHPHENTLLHSYAENSEMSPVSHPYRTSLHREGEYIYKKPRRDRGGTGPDNRLAPRTIALTALLMTALLGANVSLLSQPAAAQTVPLIETEGGVWADPAVSVLIIPSLGQTWYWSSYAGDAAHAVRRWAQSILVFTDTQPYNYLRQLTFSIHIQGINATSNPDVTISFIQNFPPTGTPALGETRTRINQVNNHFEPTITMTLAAQDPDQLHQLSDSDIINIATHEFGHAIGLGHTNTLTTDDNFLELMSTTYNLPVGNANNPLEAPSTLDLYALATIYDWLASSATLTGPGEAATVINLPTNIAYTAVYPYAEQLEALRTSLDQASQRIIILAILTASLLAITLTLAILLARRRPTPAPVFPSVPPEPAPTVVQGY